MPVPPQPLLVIVPAFVMLQEIVLMVTPGAIWSAKPMVPVSPPPVDGGGGEQAGSVADKKLETRIAVRA